MSKEPGRTSVINRLCHPRVVAVHPNFQHLEPFFRTLPELFRGDRGTVIHKGRNELRAIQHEGQTYVVKSFHRPNLLNRFVYGAFRGSKAKRSYLYAERFLQIGVGTPQPVGYVEVRSGLLFDRSYYISLLSSCPHVYSELLKQKFDCEESVLHEIGRVTAVLHEHGYAHKDYGAGNILFGQEPDGSVKIEIVDLNRMYVGHVGMKRGCKNFERLPVTPQMCRCIAETYARARGFDAEECFRLMRMYRSKETTNADGLY